MQDYNRQRVRQRGIPLSIGWLTSSGWEETLRRCMGAIWPLICALGWLCCLGLSQSQSAPLDSQNRMGMISGMSLERVSSLKTHYNDDERSGRVVSRTQVLFHDSYTEPSCLVLIPSG